MRTVDLLNSIFIIIVFILLYVSNILAIGKKNIENNWAVYRCSPMVMPFASMFGHDTMQNFAYCIQNMQTNFMAPMLAPSNYSNVLAVSGVSAAIDGQTGSLGLLSNVRGFLENNFGSLFNVFGNISLLMTILVERMRDMMGKLVGTFYTIGYMMVGTADTAQSTWNALPGQLLRGLG
jgi:hypothetical protein